jgi:hypothetical protein
VTSNEEADCGDRRRAVVEGNERTESMGKTIMGVAAVSLDGFIADHKDDVGPRRTSSDGGYST